MATINLYAKTADLLKAKKNPEMMVLLYYKYRHQDSDAIFSTGEKVYPHWFDLKLKKVKVLKENKKEADQINIRLSDFKSKLDKIVTTIRTEDKEPTVNEVRNRFEGKKIWKNSEPKEIKDFYYYFDLFVQDAKENVGLVYRTIQSYTTTLEHLRLYQKHKRIEFDINKIDLDFINKYKQFLLHNYIKGSYLKDGKIICRYKKEVIGLLDSSISKDFKNLKTFSIWMNKEGYINNQFYKKIKVEDIDSDIVVLEKEELQHLSTLTLKPALQKHLDIFLVGSTTGLRVEDLLNLSPKKIILNENDLTKCFIKRKTYKTNKDVILPLVPFIAKILLKYKGLYETALPTVSKSKYNGALKKIGKLAGFTGLVEKIYLKDGKQISEIKEKYKFIASHMARRNFICLMIKSGETAETVMDLSGHLDYKSFKKYLKFFDGDRIKAIDRAFGNMFEDDTKTNKTKAA